MHARTCRIPWVTAVAVVTLTSAALSTANAKIYFTENFRRYADKQCATALWTARGEADFTVAFDGNAKVRVFDMYGRETQQSGQSIVVKAGTAPAYLLSD